MRSFSKSPCPRSLPDSRTPSSWRLRNNSPHSKANCKSAVAEDPARRRWRASWSGSPNGGAQETNNLTLMRKEYPSRILAVDIRSCRFGYAVFQMPAQLLDSGIARFESPGTATDRIAALCKMFRPSRIVLRKELVRRGRSYCRANAVRRALRNEAKRRLIPIVTVEERTLNNWFHRHGKAGKYAIASFVADRLPQLSWKLPPRRKPWQPEPWNLCLFDAVALGIVHTNEESETDPFPPS